MIPLTFKEECKECGYWDCTKRQRYKCYTSRCPAKQRDDRASKDFKCPICDRIFPMSKHTNTGACAGCHRSGKDKY